MHHSNRAILAHIMPDSDEARASRPRTVRYVCMDNECRSAFRRFGSVITRELPPPRPPNPRKP